MRSGKLHRIDAICRFISSTCAHASIRKCSNYHKRMEKLYVRCSDEEDRMQMTLSFGIPGKKEKTMNLNRTKDEELGKSLERINNGVIKYVALKTKKKKPESEKNSQEEQNKLLQPDACLYFEGREVDKSIPNKDAWKQDSILKLINYEYHVIYNQPSILSLALPKCVMADFPIFPKYDLEFADVENCIFTWSKSVKDSFVETQPIAGQSGTPEPKQKKTVDISYEEVGHGLHYTPTVEDVGCQIKLKCTPVCGLKEGDSMEVVAAQLVDAGPGVCPFEDRHIYTKNHSEFGSMRVVSYNVLADYYADSDFSRTVLFPQCPPYALCIDYRKQLFLKEILGYNADLICIQEMDKKIFQSDLSPALHMIGYQSLLKQKAGQVPEGCAMFFRDSKLQLLAQHDIDFSDALGNDPSYSDLLETVCKSEALQTKILAKGTTLQVAVLDCVESPGKRLVVMNTHFYFHPRSAHIRLIHAAMAMRHMQYVCEMYKDSEGTLPAVVFCGDFNSTPTTGVYKFFTENNIQSDHVDWLADGGEEYFGGIDLQHNYKTLASACGTPPFTNFTGGFQDCLDYIFIDTKQLETQQVIPLPSEDILRQHIALPNIVFPSDHLALVCDVKWKC